MASHMTYLSSKHGCCRIIPSLINKLQSCWCPMCFLSLFISVTWKRIITTSSMRGVIFDKDNMLELYISLGITTKKLSNNKETDSDIAEGCVVASRVDRWCRNERESSLTLVFTSLWFGVQKRGILDSTVFLLNLVQSSKIFSCQHRQISTTGWPMRVSLTSEMQGFEC